MEKIFSNFIKYIVLSLMIIISGFALYVHYSGNGFDPVKVVQSLKDEDRRDDALDMVRFFKENHTGDINTLDRIEKELEYTVFEKVGSFADGAVTGDVHDAYSGTGAFLSDLCVYGDIRDTGIQSYRYLTDRNDFDEMVLFLSALGLTLSAKPMIHSQESMVKNIIKYIRNIPRSLRKGFLKECLTGKVSREYSKKLRVLLKKTILIYPVLPAHYQISAQKSLIPQSILFQSTREQGTPISTFWGKTLYPYMR